MPPLGQRGLRRQPGAAPKRARRMEETREDPTAAQFGALLLRSKNLDGLDMDREVCLCVCLGCCGCGSCFCVSVEVVGRCSSISDRLVNAVRCAETTFASQRKLRARAVLVALFNTVQCGCVAERFCGQHCEFARKVLVTLFDTVRCGCVAERFCGQHCEFARTVVMILFGVVRCGCRAGRFAASGQCSVARVWPWRTGFVSFCAARCGLADVCGGRC